MLAEIWAIEEDVDIPSSTVVVPGTMTADVRVTVYVVWRTVLVMAAPAATALFAAV